MLCKDLAEISAYAKVDNDVFRLLRSHTPGPYTFILAGSREVPRRLLNQQRRTIGIRVPGHPVTLALLEALGEPLMSVSLIPPDSDMPISDPEDIERRFGHLVDWIIDTGEVGVEASTVVDLSGETPRILRVGIGEISRLGIAVDDG